MDHLAPWLRDTSLSAGVSKIWRAPDVHGDYKVNLEKVQRHGVDLELGGHLTDALSFYLTYAWQKLYNKGHEPAGEVELHRRAEHRVSAGLRYALFHNTTLMVDYYYQSAEITEVSEEIGEDEWYFREERNPAYNLFDFGVEQLLLKRAGPLQDLKMRFYVKNIFDEKYFTPSLYPATDRTFGVTLSVQM